MPCPKCGSTRTKRSHSRNFKERLQKLFNQRPYRCIDCDWRGILKAKPSCTKRDAKKYMLIQIISIIIIIIAIYLIILYLDRKDMSHYQQNAKPYTEALASQKLANNLNLAYLNIEHRTMNCFSYSLFTLHVSRFLLT